MAGEVNPVESTVPASGDLSASQYRAVKLNSSGSAAVAASGTEGFYGVLTNKPAAANRAARVVVRGRTKMEAGAAVGVGDLITAVAGGRGSPAVAAPGTAVGTSHILGQAVSAAGASADLFEIEVSPYYRVRA